MGRVAEVVLLCALVVVGQVVSSAAYGGPNQYVLNYGVELSELEQQIPVKAGLAWGFYAQSCPVAESLVASTVAAALKSDGGIAGGLLRLFFHDCFVQGCDGSILLRLPSGTELDDIPNQTIRASALKIVDDIKAILESKCPRIVSCADIIVLATKVAVQQAGGPAFNVPLGRLDSLTFSTSTGDLPSPRTTFQEQSTAFSRKGLDNTDLVALAGGHTLGVAHCGAFNSRLFPTVDPKLNPSYASYLKTNVCPTLSNTNSTGLDFYSPNKFDNQYFKNLPTGGALLASDQNLDQDATAWNLVKKWAGNQTDFFNQFLWSFIKMSQIGTTGVTGEVRKVCSTTNSGRVSSESGDETLHLVQSVESELVETRNSEPEPSFISMVVDGKADA